MLGWYDKPKTGHESRQDGHLNYHDVFQDGYKDDHRYDWDHYQTNQEDLQDGCQEGKLRFSGLLQNYWDSGPITEMDIRLLRLHIIYTFS